MDKERQNLLDRLLTEAMNAEEEARKFYEDAASKASSQAGKKLFTELADFEQGHYDRLKNFIEERSTGKKTDRHEPTREFSGGSEVEGEFEPNKDEIAKVLSIGIEAEKKAQAKYLEIAKMFDDAPSKTIFTNMAEEERKHETILDNQFYSLSNKGTMIWGD